jgi:hypothetical protein
MGPRWPPYRVQGGVPDLYPACHDTGLRPPDFVSVT